MSESFNCENFHWVRQRHYQWACHCCFPQFTKVLVAKIWSSAIGEVFTGGRFPLFGIHVGTTFESSGETRELTWYPNQFKTPYMLCMWPSMHKLTFHRKISKSSFFFTSSSYPTFADYDDVSLFFIRLVILKLSDGKRNTVENVHFEKCPFPSPYSYSIY